MRRLIHKALDPPIFQATRFIGEPVRCTIKQTTATLTIMLMSIAIRTVIRMNTGMGTACIPIRTAVRTRIRIPIRTIISTTPTMPTTLRMRLARRTIMITMTRQRPVLLQKALSPTLGPRTEGG
jgi:hypothetical protein